MARNRREEKERQRYRQKLQFNSADNKISEEREYNVRACERGQEGDFWKTQQKELTEEKKKKAEKNQERTHFKLCTRNLRNCLLVGCLMSQQHARISQGPICSDNCMCCHTEIEVADQTFYLTQSEYTDAGPTSPSADPLAPGAWQGSHWSANF